MPKTACSVTHRHPAHRPLNIQSFGAARCAFYERWWIVARPQRRLSWFWSLLFALLALLITGSAAAQPYPSQPVSIILGFGAGGEIHRTAQLIGERLSERLGQPVNLENRAGANAAAEAVVRAPADGHTLLLAHAANAINATLYDKLNFNFTHDITPVAGLVRVPLVIVVNPSFPPRSVPELIAYARANPGKVGMGLPAASTIVLAAGSFTMTTGLDLTHVPYPGDGPAIRDLIAGKVQFQFAGLGAAKGYLASGQLRALAVTTATRVQVLPDVPTVGEFVRGYELTSWFGIGAPRNVRSEIVERLEKDITAILSDSDVQARIIDSGHVPVPMPRAAFEKFIAAETDKFGKLVTLTGLKPQ